MIQTYKDRYSKKVTTLMKVFLLILFMSFIVYSKPSSQPDDTKYSNEREKSYMSSVSFIDGQYKIDSSIVESDRNKDTLVADLKGDDIIRKTTIDEIPEFMLAFLDSISINKKFDMANPWEEWRSGDIMDLVLPNMDVNSENKFNKQESDVRKHLPDKKLIYFGIGRNSALLSYLSGGIRTRQHVLVIKFQNERVIDFWFGAYLGLYLNTRLEILEQLEGRNNGHGGC